MSIGKVWIVRGEVTDVEGHEEKCTLGQIEWQFSDGPVGRRGSSSDFLSLEEGLKYYSGYTFFWDPEN